MYISNLYREPHGLQDTIEVGVVRPEDRRYLLSHQIQVDLYDEIFKIYALVKLASGRTFTVDKVGSIADLYSAVVAKAKAMSYV